jgi:hypothetical protein
MVNPGFQNTPVITDASSNGTITKVRFTLNGIPSSSFTVQIFASVAAGPSGYGEGELLIATVPVNTDTIGYVVTGVVDVAVPHDLAGRFVTAAATDPAGNTSEFSRAVRVL